MAKKKEKTDLAGYAIAIFIIAVVFSSLIYLYFKNRDNKPEDDIIGVPVFVTTTTETTTTVLGSIKVSCIVRTYDFGNGTKRFICVELPGLNSDDEEIYIESNPYGKVTGITPDATNVLAVDSPVLNPNSKNNRKT